MKLFEKMAAEENANLAEKIIEMHEKLKKELHPYLKEYLLSQASSEAEKSMLDDENLVDIKINQADISEYHALKFNAKSLEAKLKPNQNQNKKNLKKQNKREEITDFIEAAVNSVLSEMKRAQLDINQKNYADAVERSMLANKALGCLVVAEKLSHFNKLIKKETEDKIKGANAKNKHLPQVKEIVLSIAKKYPNLFKSQKELFKRIEDECEAEIIVKLEIEAINWEPGNFIDVFKRRAEVDREFDKNINLLLKS